MSINSQKMFEKDNVVYVSNDVWGMNKEEIQFAEFVAEYNQYVNGVCSVAMIPLYEGFYETEILCTDIFQIIEICISPNGVANQNLKV